MHHDDESFDENYSLVEGSDAANIQRRSAYDDKFSATTMQTTLDCIPYDIMTKVGITSFMNC